MALPTFPRKSSAILQVPLTHLTTVATFLPKNSRIPNASQLYIAYGLSYKRDTHLVTERRLTSFSYLIMLFFRPFTLASCYDY